MQYGSIAIILMCMWFVGRLIRDARRKKIELTRFYGYEYQETYCIFSSLILQTCEILLAVMMFTYLENLILFVLSDYKLPGSFRSIYS